jgi:hypothetical protein
MARLTREEFTALFYAHLKTVRSGRKSMPPLHQTARGEIISQETIREQGLL